MVPAVSLRTERRTQLVEITQLVQDAVGGADDAAAVLVYVPHTTAGITINENADPAVGRDFERALERMVGTAWGWEHVEAHEENAPSHIRAALMGPQVGVIPLDGAAASRSAPGRASSSASSTARGSARST